MTGRLIVDKVESPGALALTANGNDALYIDSNGRVGVGTSTPSSELHVAGSILAVETIESRGSVKMFPYRWSTGGGGNVGFYDFGVEIGQVGGDTDQTYIGAFGARPLVLYTNNVEKMRITSDGNVGIGTATPSAILQINGPAYTEAVLSVNNTAEGIMYSEAEYLVLHGLRGNLYLDSKTNFIVRNRDSLSTPPIERMRITSDGDVLIGTATPITDAKLIISKASGNNVVRVDTSLSDGEYTALSAVANARNAELGVYKHSGIANNCAFLYLQETDGNNAYYWTDDNGLFRISATSTHVGTTSGTVVGAQSSDERIKNIIGPVPYGLEEVLNLDTVRYTLKSDEEETPRLGFIAQQVNPIIPESVFDTNEDMGEGEPTRLGMEYVALIPVLVNAIKELKAELDEVKSRL